MKTDVIIVSMKIGLVCPYSVTKHGGVLDVIQALRDHLTTRGHTVRIITPRPYDFTGPDDDFIFIGQGHDITVSVLKTTGQISSAERLAAAEMLARERFDVLHFHEPWVPFLSTQLLQANQTLTQRARTVGTFHARLPNSLSAKAFARLFRFYTKPTLRYLDTLTAVSSDASRHLRQLTKRDIEIIPNGVELKRFSRPSVRKSSTTAAPKRNTKTILFVGRLEPRKGVKYLVKAFHELSRRHDNVQLVIGGDGVDRPSLEKLVADRQIPHVEFLGRFEEEQKPALLQSADIFCSPALYGESFGIVLIEAMAADTPVVAGDNPGYSSVLTGAGAISLVNPRQTTAFADKLEEFLYDDALRREWLAWAQSEINQYSYDTVTAAYEETYQ